MKKNSLTTDAFFLQEVDESIYSQIKKILPDFTLFHKDKGIYFLASFIKRDLPVRMQENMLDTDISMGLAAMFGLSSGSRRLYISNVHGAAQPGDKRDNPARLKQSKEIVEFNSKVKGARIIGGDFNLLPDTQSIKIFEEAGFTNLIRKYGVKRTRNSHAWRQARELAKNGIPHYGKQLFADYVFVSPEVKVKNFEVPKVEVSDHLPLILDFTI